MGPSPLPVADIGANAPELIDMAAGLLSGSKQRTAIFAGIYRGKKKIKTVDQLMELTGLERKRVLGAGKVLADLHIVNQIKVGGRVAYEKVGFYQTNKAKILRVASNPKARQKLVTKRRPQVTATVVINGLEFDRTSVRAKRVTVDDIGSFAKVGDIPYPDQYYKIPEEDFKFGIARILGELGDFKDWGGERNDLFSSHLLIQGERKMAAFAFKGPGKEGKLWPGKMGKRGDQIQRLASCPADVFIVQFWGEIEQSVLEQLERLVQARSLLEQRQYWYGIIDGSDSVRIIEAYPEAFPNIQLNTETEKV